jgi:hypothetical protein
MKDSSLHSRALYERSQIVIRHFRERRDFFMWKAAFIAYTLSALFLVGCNTNNDNDVNDETPMEDVKDGANDVMNDVDEGVNDVIDDTDDPDNNNPNNSAGTNGQINEGTINNGDVNGNGTGENGITAPGAPTQNSEDIIEDKADRKDKDNIDNQ